MNARHARTIRAGLSAGRHLSLYPQLLWLASHRDDRLAVRAFYRGQRLAARDRAARAVTQSHDSERGN